MFQAKTQHHCAFSLDLNTRNLDARRVMILSEAWTVHLVVLVLGVGVGGVVVFDNKTSHF